MLWVKKMMAFQAFGKRVWALAAPYFGSEDKWAARGLLAAIVSLNLGTVYMAVQFNDWYGVFYDALQAKDPIVFWQQLGRFSYLAVAAIVIAVYKFYLTQLLEVRWRAWLTRNYLTRWLTGHAFYRLELARFAAPLAGQTAQTERTERTEKTGQITGDEKTSTEPLNLASPDNPDQRIQEDLNQFTTFTVSLSMGLLNALVTLVSFVGILWTLSGSFTFSVAGSSYTIPGFMVWAALAYCAVGSVLTHYIGRRQIGLNFFQQRYEADFRHHMVRVREYSESIALDKGGPVERSQLELKFSAVLTNYLHLIRAQKSLVWFTSFFGQAAVIFPFVVAAPRFFSGAIQLGQLMQISSAFGKVQESLSWFVDNYSNLAAWRATTDRLTSFEDNMTALRQQGRTQRAIDLVATEAASQTTSPPVLQPISQRAADAIPTSSPPSNTLSVSALTLGLPTGQVLLDSATFSVSAGDAVLLTGPSGSGKSTLFRAFAGIWPHSTGRIHTPLGAMFIPQRPYFPDGSLRGALAYPEPATHYSDEALGQALHDALLPHLAKRLDAQDAWGQKLSGGEQQRLAIARVLLKKPQWIFADEATSALDEATEKALYVKLQAHITAVGGAMVSIAHRPGVAAFHNWQWTLEELPSGAPARYKLNSHPRGERAQARA